MAKLSVSDRLRKAAKVTASAPTARPTLEGHEELVDRVISKKQELADMAVAYEQLEAALHEKTRELYDDARKSGNYASSILADGKKTNGAMVVYSDKFSNLPVDLEPTLRKNDPKYDEHFVEVRKLSVKRDAGKTISDKTIETLMNALGADFDKIFDVKVEIGTVKGTAENWFNLPETIRLALTQAKASTRNVTKDGKVIS